MNIEIKETFDESAFADIARLFDEESWSASSPTDPKSVRKSVENSYCAYGAFDGKKLVGFFRALSDGVSDAYLLDLVVDKNYRGRGIASALIKKIVSRLKLDGVEWITAISTPEGIGTYSKTASKMPGHVPFRF